MTNCLRHAVFENTSSMEFKNIPELANQPSREQYKLAAHSEHKITGHKYRFSSALQVKEDVSHLTNPPPFYF